MSVFGVPPDGGDGLDGLDQITKPVHQQRVFETRTTFVLACLLLILGAGLITWGALRSQSQLLIEKTAAGALISLVGGTVLKLHKSAHEQLEKYRRDRATPWT
jgi:hypothetical protein